MILSKFRQVIACRHMIKVRGNEKPSFFYFPVKDNTSGFAATGETN